MATATIRDVELVSTGTWSASTGVTRVERADLESILAAATDPNVDAAPIKLGHIDPRFDGEPAAGWVQPKRIESRGQRDVLVGDLVGMPAKLAEVAPTAYRRRSVEILWRVKTAGGKQYRAVLTGIALLGVAAPAVKGLADVMALFRAEHPLEGEAGNLRIIEGLDAERIDLLRALPADVDQDTRDRIAVAMGAADTADVPPPVTDPANDDRQQTQGGRMLTDDRVREILRLEADADVEAELQRIAATTTAPDTTVQPSPGAEPTQPNVQPGTEGDQPESQPAPVNPPATTETETPAAQPELVTLSAGNLAQLQADAAAGRAAADTLAAQRRADLLNTAVRSGRIAPAERTAFAASLERDEEGTTALLSSLAPRFAVSELGADNAPELAGIPDEVTDQFRTSTFPELAK
jgi:hypothetical protein